MAELTTTDQFWLVWSRGKARMKHRSLASATAEAIRLAKCRPGRAYYVVEMVGCVREPPLTPQNDSAIIAPVRRNGQPDEGPAVD